jgi:hypothetical protein
MRVDRTAYSHCTCDTLDRDLSGHMVDRDRMNLDLEIIGGLIERGVCRGRDNAKIGEPVTDDLR